MYKLNSPRVDEYSKLLEIWEASVRATHHFLQKEDIDFFKRTIQEHRIFEKAQITVLRDEADNILGFLGVAGNFLEMLFINPSFRGTGIGKQLLLYAIHHLNITKVDVNEQNKQAVQFYEHFGFKTIARSAVDGTGKPYPILHMELQ